MTAAIAAASDNPSFSEGSSSTGGGVISEGLNLLFNTSHAIMIAARDKSMVNTPKTVMDNPNSNDIDATRGLLFFILLKSIIKLFITKL